MVLSCYLCKRKRQRGNITLHQFPTNFLIRKIWARFCNLNIYTDDMSSLRLCCRHFTNDDFKTPYTAHSGKRYLKDEAVPSIYSVIRQREDDIFVEGSSGFVNNEHINVNTSEDIAVAGSSESVNNEHINVNSSEDIAVAESSESVNNEHINDTSEDIAVAGLSGSGNNGKVNRIYSMCSNNTPKRRRYHEPRYIGEVEAKDFETPRRRLRTLQMMKMRFTEKNKRFHCLQKKCVRLKKKLQSLEQLINHIKENGLIQENAADNILDLIPGKIKNIVKRSLRKGKYDPEIRCFALTLHFYSPKAYRYIRRTCKNLLPHPATLREWYKIVDGSPGFTKEAFDAIALKTKNNPIVVNLIFDEMAIREQMLYNNGIFSGSIDIGTTTLLDKDNAVMANNALVLMVVPFTQHWKIPIGYFLIRSLSSTEKANLIIKALCMLQDINVTVSSITFDGLSSNFSMARILGAKCEFQLGKSCNAFFKHPITSEEVYIFLDPCNMLKLVRNTLGERKSLLFKEKKIEWRYIEKLEELQRQEGLRAANKLTKKHINFQNNKMNVKLAFQTLSQSVAKALIFLKRTDSSEQFAESGATADFCLYMNNVADILNCKNQFSKKEFDCPLNRNTFTRLQEYANNFKDYVINLKDDKRVAILNSNRKTGFLGLLIDLENIFNLFNKVENMGQKYLLTFKLSQDYLETFFCAIRSRGGYNINPNVEQFKSAYKRLLIQHEIKEVESGNCLSDAIDILHISSKKENMLNPLECSVFDNESDQDYDNFHNLSSYVEHITEYIAGFVCSKIDRNLNCNICRSMIYGKLYKMPLLSKLKNFSGSYKTPSTEVMLICKRTESYIRQYKNDLFKHKNFKQFLTVKIIRTLLSSTFNNNIMNDHILSQSVLDNHKIQLIKIIISYYIDVRLYHECKLKSEKSENIRQKYTKLILFKNQ